MKKKYIIFDLDGTIIDSHTDIKNNILDFIKKNEPDFLDKVKYLLNFDKITHLKDLLLKVFNNKEKAIKYTKEIYKHLNTIRGNTIFYSGVPEKITELSKKYKLFLSTGSSTEFARKTLIKGKIEKYFELIYGSDNILKGVEHLEIFADYSSDPDFYKKSISIGDGDMDKYFASQKNIDFIRVGNRGQKDENQINSIIEIDKFL